LFGRLIVYFKRPKGVQSAAFGELCPAVTLECGRPGQQFGVEHALDFIDTCLHLSTLSSKPVPPQSIYLYHTVAQVFIKAEIDFSFHNKKAGLVLTEEVDVMNFTDIPAGTIFGNVTDGMLMPLIAKDEHGNDVSDLYFEINDQQLRLKRNTMPSMLTLDENVIKQDCFCYLMEKFQL
jgi:hypothetical protein